MLKNRILSAIIFLALCGFSKATAGSPTMVIYFEENTSGVADDNKDSAAIDFLKKSTLPIIVSAHAWEEGNPKWARVLSEHRASNVLNYLAMRGIPREQIRLVPYGDKKPATKNQKLKHLNRRVEISLDATRVGK